MADVAIPTTQSKHQTETTFKNYKPEDAAKYAAHRLAYPPKLMEIVLKSHLASGGQNGHVLDVGCGPGLATKQIASHFQHVTGADASPSMIENARQSPCLSASGKQATFEVVSAEEIDTIVAPNSIDLITVATAAHWFDMPRFYAAASKILKPSGSIAIWCGGRVYADPKSTPNFESVRKLWDDLEVEIIRPYDARGNVVVRDLYIDLDLPWTIDPATQPSTINAALSAYDRSTSLRREFNKDGIPEPGPEFAESNGFLKWRKVPLVAVANMLGTSSPITRWREAHREQLEKGEIEDCVDYMMKATRAELAKAGPEGEQRDWIEFGESTVLLLIKKSA